jgi:hypothetical protein
LLAIRFALDISSTVRLSEKVKKQLRCPARKRRCAQPFGRLRLHGTATRRLINFGEADRFFGALKKPDLMTLTGSGEASAPSTVLLDQNRSCSGAGNHRHLTNLDEANLFRAP